MIFCSFARTDKGNVFNILNAFAFDIFTSNKFVKVICHGLFCFACCGIEFEFGN